MTRRRKSAPYVAPPPDPPVVLPETTWAHARFRSPQHMALNMRQIVEAAREGYFLVPEFQRGYVWTDAQVCRLFDSILRGYSVGSMLLWERYMQPREVEIGGLRATSGNNVQVVLDGHQRLASIVRAATSDRFSFDLLTGELRVDAEPGPWTVTAHAVIEMSFNWLFDNEPAHAAKWGINGRAWQTLAVKLSSALDRSCQSMVVLASDYSRQEVVEMFRRLNTEGTPMSAEDLDRALTEMDR